MSNRDTKSNRKAQVEPSGGGGLSAPTCSADTRIPSRERGCTGKINLGKSYKKQADKLSEKHGKKYGVYRCNYCGGTHLTTKIYKACLYAELLHVSEPNVIEQPPVKKRRNQKTTNYE